MDITLEKIELVKDRTGASYKEAKEALEQAEGNVVDAIIAIEEACDGVNMSGSSNGVDSLIEKMKAIVKKGNVSRILVKKDEEVILNIPLNAGIIGTVVAPWGMIAGVVAAFGFKCKIEFVKDDGSVVGISDKANDVFEGAKEKGTDFYEEIKGKAPEMYDDLKEKGESVYNKAKDAASDIKDKIMDKKEDLEVHWEDIVENAEDAVASAKDKVEDKATETVETVEDIVAEASEGVDSKLEDLDEKLDKIEKELEDR